MIRGRDQLKRFILEKDITNFRESEFVCPHCGDVVIDPVLVTLLQEFRDKVRRPVVITSVYRCEVYNREIGGVPNSSHTRGYAIDVAVKDSAFRHALLDFLVKNGVSRFGIAEDFIHFDLDPDKPHEVVWVYGKLRHIA